MPDLIFPALSPRKRAFGAFCAAIVFLLLAGCAKPPHPAQRLSRYAGFQSASLASRVKPADAAVIDRAHRTNLGYGMDIRPKPTAAGHPLFARVREVLSGLPPPVKRLAERHLGALYLVSDDFGTAVTEGIGDGSGDWPHGYIALNATALNRKANAWATWKENSAFRPAKGHRLSVQIEREGDDDQTGAVRFIVLHELGHLLGLALKVHAYWETSGPAPPERFPFPRLSWRGAPKGKTASRWKKRFPRLHQAGFYRFGKAPFSLAEMESVYDMLSRTDFPSLYGATNLFDDFAEAFAIYVHTRLLGKPYRVTLTRNGKVLRVYRSCLQTGKCPEKAAFLRDLLKGRQGDAGKIEMLPIELAKPLKKGNVGSSFDL